MDQMCFIFKLEYTLKFSKANKLIPGLIYSLPFEIHNKS